jgi:hypothetical protein
LNPQGVAVVDLLVGLQHQDDVAIRPDGTQPAPEGFTGPAESIPWGLNIDGNDDVWVGNMWGRSAALLAGDNTAGHPPGTKAGDVIHIFQSGSIQMVTDVSIDPAGNV